MISKSKMVIFAALILMFGVSSAYGMDSDITRRTLARLPGFFVVFEELQPNVRQYAIASGMTREQLLKDVELRLQKAGIGIFSQEQWLKIQGRPVLYVNVNTHIESANIAYSIRVEVRQIVFTDSNPAVKTLAGTWGIDMTGITKTGKLDVVRDLFTLVDKFIEAYWTVNKK